MLRQLFSIARNTFVEAIRQPVFTVLLLMGALGLILNVFLSAYSMEPGEGDNKVLIDLGLSTVLLVTLLLAAFTATGVLSEEIENRTVLTVVSKPVPRPVFVVGKFLGVGTAIALAYWVLSIVFLMTIRHQVLQNASDDLDWPVWAFGFGGAAVALLLAIGGNYLYRRSFTSAFVLLLGAMLTVGYAGVLVFGKEWVLQSPLYEFTEDEGKTLQIAVGLALMFEAVVILTAVAVTVSTRFGQVMTILISFGVFLVGLVSNSLSGWVNSRLSLPGGVGIYESIAAVFTADIGFGLKLVYAASKMLYLVLPNLQFFWPADAISQGNSMLHDPAGNFTLVPLVTHTGYGVLQTVALVCIAVALFQRREVG